MTDRQRSLEHEFHIHRLTTTFLRSPLTTDLDYSQVFIVISYLIAYFYIRLTKWHLQIKKLTRHIYHLLQIDPEVEWPAPPDRPEAGSLPFRRHKT